MGPTNVKALMQCAAIVSTIMIYCSVKRNNEKKRCRKRRIWCRQWLERRGEGRGVLNLLNEELKSQDPQAYRNFLRLTNSQFEEIRSSISSTITKEDTVMRQSISARNKLEVTMRFLATGETFRSLMFYTRIHETTISRFIPEVCKAICNALQTKYLNAPSSIDDWLEVSNDFNAIWQFPHCLGALDGWHIEFRAPVSAGSYYYNYKGTHSIVLLGLVDAKYKFTYVNIGVNGRISDGGVFNRSALYRGLSEKTLHIPYPQPLPGQKIATPYVIVADDAFPLSVNLIKPYPSRELSEENRIFNYRLSRALRVVENAFGILANRFRVLLNPIGLAVDKVELITVTCVVLHNYLATNNGKTYTDIDVETIQQLEPLAQQCGNRSSESARDVRNNFKKFFNSTFGSVPWQQKSIQMSNY